jgi:hypothetical protein
MGSPNEGSATRGSAGSQAAGGREGGGAHITGQDRTRIHGAMSGVRVREATNLHVRASVGVVVPHTVTEYWEPVPTRIIDIVPAWRGYYIVRVSGDYLIINPASYRVVYVLR